MRLFATTLAATAALVALPRPASACSLATNDIWIQNEAHASDATPPSQPIVGAIETDRHYEDGGCGAVASCGSFGTMQIEVSATDDRATARDIGYDITIVGGNPPAGFDPSRERVTTAFDGGSLIFFFDVDAPDFTVDLEIRAVDGNGNVGEPTLVTVRNEAPASGCLSAGKRNGGLVGFAVIAFATAFALRRRRR